MSEANETKTRFASRDQLLGAKHKVRYGSEKLPVAGLTVRFASISQRKYTGFKASLMSRRRAVNVSGLKEAEARLICLCVVDEAGNQLLNEKKDIPAILEWDSADAEFLADRIARHCGMDLDDLGNLTETAEDVAKNSGSIPSA